PEGLEEAGAVVGIEVMALQAGHAAAAVDIAAGNGAADAVVVAVGIFQYRGSEGRRVAGALEAMAGLHGVPAVVLAALQRRLLHVHFLILILPDVGDVEVARGPVEAEAPGVAQAE